jgi:hypothetical protein
MKESISGIKIKEKTLLELEITKQLLGLLGD